MQYYEETFRIRGKTINLEIGIYPSGNPDDWTNESEFITHLYPILEDLKKSVPDFEKYVSSRDF